MHHLQTIARRAGRLADDMKWGDAPVTQIDPEANQKGKPTKVIDAQMTPAKPEPGDLLYTGGFYDPARPPYVSPGRDYPPADLPATGPDTKTDQGVDNTNPGDRQDPPPAATAPGFLDSTGGKVTAALLLVVGGIALARAID